MVLRAIPGLIRNLERRARAWDGASPGELHDHRRHIIGTFAAFGVGRAAQSILFEMAGFDPIVVRLVTLLLAAVAIGAGYLPALRVSRVDPMRALRYE